MSVQITRQGQVVAQSRNLRGILDYARKSYVFRAVVTRASEGRGDLYVQYDDGSECRTRFESFEVCLGFVRGRRSWGLEPVRCSDSYWTFFIPSSDARAAIR